MAYDAELVEQIRAILSDRPHLVVKKMFGGVGFILNGNMAVGVLNNDLIIRTPKEQYEALLAEPHVRPMDLKRQPMRGWVMVEPPVYATDADLERWIAMSAAIAEALPPK